MTVLVLKTTLRHVHPSVWRRLEVPSDLSLAELSEVLLRAFGWHGGHLHHFYVGAGSWPTYYGPAFLQQDDSSVQDETKKKAGSLLKTPGDSIGYEYDFGDGWDHRVVLEKKIRVEEGIVYPRCTGGRQPSPLDDTGGPGGWSMLLSILSDTSHPEHLEMAGWMEEVHGLTPSEICARTFDLEETNRLLASLQRVSI